MFNVDKKSNVCSSRDFFIASPLGPFNDYVYLIIIYLLLFFCFYYFLLHLTWALSMIILVENPGPRSSFTGFLFTWPLQKVREETNE